MHPTRPRSIKMPRPVLATSMRGTARITLWLPCLIGLLSPMAHAQDLTSLSLDQLLNVEVVTASKFAQKVSEAPSSVLVISAEDIKTYGYRTLADVLRSMRGIHVSYDRNYSYLGTRGSGRPGDYNGRVLLLVDGVRLNDNIYNQGSIGTEFPIDLELIERIEYVPGPGSAIYGSNAFFGVLNIITKKGNAFTGGEASVEAGSAASRKGRISVGNRFKNGAEGLLSVSGANSAGSNLYFPEFDDGASNHGVANRRDSDRYQRVFMNYRVDDLALQTYFGNRMKGVPTASYGQQFNEPNSTSTDRYFSATAAYQHTLSKSLEVYAHLNFTSYDFAGNFVYGPDSSAQNRDLGHSNTVTGELRFLSSTFQDHKLVYGLEAVDATKRQQINYDVAPNVSVLNINNPKNSYAVYVQDEFRVSDRMIINAGLRHDHDPEGGNSNNPRLGLIYKVTPDLTTKLLYGTAFRSANAYERYYVTDTSHYKTVPGLKSENIKTYEGVIEYFPRQDFRSSASLFLYRFNNLISLAADAADGLLYYTNVDAASARGIELEAERIGIDGSRLKASASMQFARNDKSGEQLTNSPRTLLKLNYSTRLGSQSARAAVEAQYTSRRGTVVDGAVGSFAVVNMTFSGIRLARNLELAASVYNVLNKNYADPPGTEHFDNGTPPRYLQGIRQDGRAMRATLIYRF